MRRFPEKCHRYRIPYRNRASPESWRLCAGAVVTRNYGTTATSSASCLATKSRTPTPMSTSRTDRTGIARTGVVAMADGDRGGGGSETLSELAFSWQLNKPIIALSRPKGGLQACRGTH